MSLHFYYDIVCPYAYMASTRVAALAARAGVEGHERQHADVRVLRDERLARGRAELEFRNASAARRRAFSWSVWW